MRKAVIVLAVLWMVMRTGTGFGATFVVSVGSLSFSPTALTIAPGDSVRWNWVAGIHTTTSGTGSTDPQVGVLWDAPIDVVHTTFARQFNTAGSFPYFCQFHELSGMKGTITVNTVPVARDTAVTTSEDTPVGAKMQAFDADGDPLTYSVLGGPFHGSVNGLVPATGTFNYTPALNYSGRDSLMFRVNDGKANSLIDTVYFTVTPVNDPPAAQDVSASIITNTPHAVGAMPVTDVDNVAWTITQTGGPFHGSVTLFDPPTGSFTYTPSLDYNGPDSVNYEANDGQANSNTAIIRLTVASGCNCPKQGDLTGDGVINVNDILAIIKIAFTNGTDIQDPLCPKTRSNVNNIGPVDVNDVLYLIKTAFSNGPPPINPC